MLIPLQKSLPTILRTTWYHQTESKLKCADTPPPMKRQRHTHCSFGFMEEASPTGEIHSYLQLISPPPYLRVCLPWFRIGRFLPTIALRRLANYSHRGGLQVRGALSISRRSTDMMSQSSSRRPIPKRLERLLRGSEMGTRHFATSPSL